MQRLLGETIAEHDVGAAALAIALQRIAAHGGAEKKEIVKMRYLALGAEAANVVKAGRGGAVNLGDRVLVEGGRTPRGCMYPAVFHTHQ